jgi:hypothetical protein
METGNVSTRVAQGCAALPQVGTHMADNAIDRYGRIAGDTSCVGKLLAQMVLEDASHQPIYCAADCGDLLQDWRALRSGLERVFDRVRTWMSWVFLVTRLITCTHAYSQC